MFYDCFCDEQFALTRYGPKVVKFNVCSEGTIVTWYGVSVILFLLGSCCCTSLGTKSQKSSARTSSRPLFWYLFGTCFSAISAIIWRLRRPTKSRDSILNLIIGYHFTELFCLNSKLTIYCGQRSIKSFY
jgi:hypothetical protein